jgi:hypothetical protein
MSRMARNPAPVIIERRIRWRRENARSAEGASRTAGGLAALTLTIVPFKGRRRGEASRQRIKGAINPNSTLHIQAEMGGHEEAADTRRLTVPEIFDAAVANAREEVKCSVGTLAFSGIAGGMTMGLSGLGVAAVRSLVSDGGWQELVSDLIYPAGFIAVMIGRAQ